MRGQQRLSQAPVFQESNLLEKDIRGQDRPEAPLGSLGLSEVAQSKDEAMLGPWEGEDIAQSMTAAWKHGRK